MKRSLLSLLTAGLIAAVPASALASGKPNIILRLDAGKIQTRYSADKLIGHAAWIDGDWKLHRIPDKAGDKIRIELYDLAKDRAETTDVAAAEADRVKTMRAALEEWQRSVIRSLNGEVY